MVLWARIFQRLLYALSRQRIPLLILLVITIGAGTYYAWLNRTNLPAEASAAGNAPVEVTVQDLAGQNISNMTLTLKEKNGQRRISMAVGTTEALAIARQRGNSQIPPDERTPSADGRRDRSRNRQRCQARYLARSSCPTTASRALSKRGGDAVALA